MELNNLAITELPRNGAVVILFQVESIQRKIVLNRILR